MNDSYQVANTYLGTRTENNIRHFPYPSHTSFKYLSSPVVIYSLMLLPIIHGTLLHVSFAYLNRNILTTII